MGGKRSWDGEMAIGWLDRTMQKKNTTLRWIDIPVRILDGSLDFFNTKFLLPAIFIFCQLTEMFNVGNICIYFICTENKNLWFLSLICSLSSRPWYLLRMHGEVLWCPEMECLFFQIEAERKSHMHAQKMYTNTYKQIMKKKKKVKEQIIQKLQNSRTMLLG